MDNGAWSEGRRLLGKMEWLLKPGLVRFRKRRLMTDEPPELLSAKQVGPGLMGVESSKLRESAIVIRSSAWEE